MPDTKPKPTKGKGLKKKYGPLPAYAYLIIGGVIVLGYLYYRRKQEAGTAPEAGSLNQQIIPSGAVVPVSGNNAGSSDTTPSGSSDSSVTMPTDYITNTDLQSGLDNLNSEVGAQIAAITFPQPNINITVPHATVAKQTVATKTAAKKAAVKAAPKKITYYSLKKNVHLKAGQKLHFTKGKGYYAA
jgi:hypothetical protein